MTPTSPSNGFTSVTVPAVTSSIDANITAGTIKDGVTILGVTGNYSGGGDSGGKYLVRVIDYDGTVLKEDHLNNGATFTLPNAPTHSGLVFDGWSSPVTITNDEITVENYDIIIGAMYYTSSGLTEFDIVVTTFTGLTVTCDMNGTKNWGDGTTDTNTSHTYTTAGSYTITCDGNTLNSSVMGSSYQDFYINARIGNNITTLPMDAFSKARALKTIIIPKTVTYFNYSGYQFENCTTLQAIVIPTSISDIPNFCFSGCSLLKVIATSNVTYSNSAMTYSGVENITIKNGVGQQTFGSAKIQTLYINSSLSNYAFQYNYVLKKVVFNSIPSSIPTALFYNCFSVIEYDFSNATSVPTLSNTNAFNCINGLCKIKVPSALYNSWITASGWSSLADYIVAV